MVDNKNHSRSSIMPIVGGDTGPAPFSVAQDTTTTTLPYSGKSVKVEWEREEGKYEAKKTY